MKGGKTSSFASMYSAGLFGTGCTIITVLVRLRTPDEIISQTPNQKSVT